jgi:hypothetical protein
MKHFPRLLAAFLAVFLLACSAVPLLSTRRSAAPAASPQTALPGPTQPPGQPTSSPLAPSPPSTTPPQILPFPWADRSPFQPDLIPAAQSILSGLPGASVYHIDLTIDPAYTSLTGKEEVLYTNRETVPLGEIHFRLFPNILGGQLSVSSAWVEDRPVKPILSALGSDLLVPLSAPLAPGAQVVLRLDFADQVPPSHPASYNTFVFAKKILSLAQFYPLIPAYDAAGWHTEVPPAYGDVTYADTAFYLVRITAPAELVIAATGVTVDRTQNGADQVLTLAAGPVRDFYIQASPVYTLASAKSGATILNTYTIAGDPTLATRTLDYTRAAFASYAARFGVYPYTVFNVTASPTQALGVEYPQEIALALDLYDPAVDAASHLLEGVLAHEVAHQWWYGLVGDDQVNQPWLDESMAQYATYLYYLDTDGASAAQAYRQDWLRRWASVGSQPIPVGRPVASYTEQSYGAIVYGRGPLVIEALANQMGAAKFAAFLKDEYKTYQWGMITTADYERLAEKDCACDLQSFFQENVNP